MATYPATLGGLKTRIITESNRDDLSDDLATALDTVIADSIEYYAAERWYWNETRVTSTTTASVEYTNRPTGARIIDAPFLIIGGVRYDLTKRSIEWIEGMYSSPTVSQPTDYAEYGDTVRWWPAPNSTYTIAWLDISDVTALDYSNDASSNAWTTKAAPLISARARLFLFSDYFRDDLGFARATNSEKVWYDRLKAETNRRLGTGRLRASP